MFRILHIKKLVFPTLILIFALSLPLFPKTALIGASKGVTLWFNVVLPALFPFFVCSEILTRTGIIKSIGILFEPIMRPLFNVPGAGSFALLMGVTCGSPVGAKLTTTLREQQIINRVEGERLIAFTNNASPVFIAGAVASGMLGKPQIGPILLFSQIMSSITIGILFGLFYKNNNRTRTGKFDSNKKLNVISRFKEELRKNNGLSVQDPGYLLGESVKSSMSAILTMGGFIILFSAIINILYETGILYNLSSITSEIISNIFHITTLTPEFIASALSGFIEITVGTNSASKLSDMEFIQKLLLISAIIGWSGLSIHFQVLSIISSTDLRAKAYIWGKIMQATISSVYTFILYYLLKPLSENTKAAFSMYETLKSTCFQDSILMSCNNLMISLIILCMGIGTVIILGLAYNYTFKYLKK